MGKYLIGASLGFVNATVEEEVEASSLEEAEQMAYEMAMENVESWAEPIDDDEEWDDED